MVEDSEADKAQFLAGLESKGVEQVRHLFPNDGYPPHRKILITEWLAAKDKETQRLSEASQNELAQTARSAKNAAWVAAVVAIIAAVITCLAWLFPRISSGP